MFARQVVVNRIEIEGLEFFVWTFATLDPGLLTNARSPLILTSDGIAGTATGTLPTNCKDILSAAKEPTEYVDFLVGG